MPRQHRGELRTLSKSIRSFAGLDLLKPFDDAEALGLCEADDSFALAFEAQAALALLVGRDADVGDDLAGLTAKVEELRSSSW